MKSAVKEYRTTFPLEDKEIEVIFRVKKEKETQTWFEELAKAFAPVREAAKKRKGKEIEKDIEKAIEDVRKT